MDPEKEFKKMLKTTNMSCQTCRDLCNKLCKKDIPQENDAERIDYYLKKGILRFNKDINIYIHNRNYEGDSEDEGDKEEYKYNHNLKKIFTVKKGKYKLYKGNKNVDFDLYKCGYEPITKSKEWFGDYLTRGYWIDQDEKNEAAWGNWKNKKDDIIFNYSTKNSYLLIEFEPINTWKDKKFKVTDKYGFKVITCKNEYLGLIIENELLFNSFDLFHPHSDEGSYDFRPMKYKMIKENKIIGYLLAGEQFQEPTYPAIYILSGESYELNRFPDNKFYSEGENKSKKDEYYGDDIMINMTKLKKYHGVNQI